MLKVKYGLSDTTNIRRYCFTKGNRLKRSSIGFHIKSMRLSYDKITFFLYCQKNGVVLDKENNPIDKVKWNQNTLLFTNNVSISDGVFFHFFYISMDTCR